MTSEKSWPLIRHLYVYLYEKKEVWVFGKKEIKLKKNKPSCARERKHKFSLLNKPENRYSVWKTWFLSWCYFILKRKFFPFFPITPETCNHINENFRNKSTILLLFYAIFPAKERKKTSDSILYKMFEWIFHKHFFLFQHLSHLPCLTCSIIPKCTRKCGVAQLLYPKINFLLLALNINIIKLYKNNHTNSITVEEEKNRWRTFSLNYYLNLKIEIFREIWFRVRTPSSLFSGLIVLFFL